MSSVRPDLGAQTAVFQSLAPRPLVSAAEAQTCLDEKFNCRNAGIFMGTQNDVPTTAFPDTVSGAYNVFIDIDGQASGALDFNTHSAAPYVGTVSFSGDAGSAAFGSANYAVTEPAVLKGMTIYFATGTGNFVGGGWTSADGTLSGSTNGGQFSASPVSSVARVGAVKSSVSIYRFVAKDLYLDFTKGWTCVLGTRYRDRCGGRRQWHDAPIPTGHGARILRR
jgi:hypothetical protein